MFNKGDLISSNVYTGMFPDVDIELGQKARLLETPRERTKDTDIAWIELVGGPHDGHQGEISPLASDWEYAEPRNISEKNI
jgi:hypothetical protein